jgi:hypothetical protein
VPTDKASHAITDLTAYEADDGSWEAYLFGPGASTAFRDRRGVWSTPAPAVANRDLLHHFTRLDSAGTDRLNWQAVRALVRPDEQQALLRPDELVRAAKDYRRRCDEARALHLTVQVLRRVSASRRTAE